MKRRSFLLLAIAFLPIAGTSVEAQSAPEDVVRAFFKAEDDQRWLDAAHMLDLNAFESIRQNTLKVTTLKPDLSRQTPEDLMKWQPDMPRAVAEWQVKQMNEGMRDFNLLEREFARVPSLDSLRALPADEAAARWLEAKGSRYATELANRQSARRPEVECPEIPDSLKKQNEGQWIPPAAVILGTTAGSDSVSYVVVGRQDWMRLSSVPILEPGVARSPMALKLRHVGGVWKIVPAFDMPYSDGATAGTVVTAVRCRMKSPPQPGLKKI